MSRLWTHYGMPNTSTGKNPQPLSRVLPFWSFLGSFWPIKRARSTISQHLLTEILENVAQTLKLLHLKYYDHTMSRSIKNHFLRCLLAKVPFEIRAFKFKNFHFSLPRIQGCVVWLWIFHWRIELRSEIHSDTLNGVWRCVENILETVESKSENFWIFKNLTLKAYFDIFA